MQPGKDHLPVTLSAPRTALKRIQIRWRGAFGSGTRFLGDHWERGYGDLAWRGMAPQRPMPWYFLAFDGKATHGYGVKTGARALCFWQVDSAGVSLWLDVRCGGRGVELGNRVLEAAMVVTRTGEDGESPFEAARAFCGLLCDQPLMPAQPVYGSNNWYYSYGKSSHQQVIRDAQLTAELSPASVNRPFVVVDCAWQIGWDDCPGGPYIGNRLFPDMPGLARALKDVGVRPGIWMRPLRIDERVPESWIFPLDRFVKNSTEHVLDPSVPDVLAQVAHDIRTLTGWGYELIKHDWTTWDLTGRWGFQMGAEFTPDTWCFADRSQTTAEVVLDLYRTIRQAAGDALIIGCNTIGHLGAGLFQLQRVGDDTSGMEWERTRKMGVNSLAFRGPQHGTFFAADADCVGLTTRIPWELNRQWLDLLARSGTPLFVSPDPKAIGPDQRSALKQAFALAAQELPLGEPLDWLDTTCPSKWRLMGEVVSYDWFGDEGAWPF
ncbi:MAG: hypothetical protein CVU38_06800 [Chloroflexi bacterium HGW-Chloroflexi-1]|nr:MAG: hypothetical protein CVU38_06800 [Chloroflexi bacterium HGW-Chloroflexi-1]